MIRSPLASRFAAALAAAALGGAASASAGSLDATRAALARISASDRRGPELRAVIAVAPDAEDQARRLDRVAGGHAGGSPLRGAPILIKDNIDVAGLPTTAGSLALADNIPPADAPLVARLRAAGLVILGKTNLSEWANFRSNHSISGWSAVGGQARNPHDPRRDPCGSSSGSAAAVAAGYVRIAVGTETDGSITCPASVNGVVGLKPTVGLVPSRGIVPISASQDAAGPIAATVREAAELLTILAARDDYAADLDSATLKGARIGVLRFAAGFHPETDALFDKALARLRAAGAILVEIAAGPGGKDLDAAEQQVLLTEFKVGVEAYLAGADAARVKARTLADLLAFDQANAAREMPLFGQDIFEAAAKTKGLADPAYLAAKATALRLARDGLDAMLAKDRLDALVAPTSAPAWLIDPILKDNGLGGAAGQLAAVAGYPHLTVPMGAVMRMPVGLSFIGPAWSEKRLLRLGRAFEVAGRRRSLTPGQLVAGVNEAHRVLHPAVQPDLVVQVRPRRAAGRAHRADLLARGDPLADMGADEGEVAVAGHQPVGVCDLDGVAVAGSLTGERDHAGSGRRDRRVHRRGEILAGVEGGLAGERIGAEAEAAALPRARHRPAQRQGVGLGGEAALVGERGGGAGGLGEEALVGPGEAGDGIVGPDQGAAFAIRHATG